MSAVRTMTSTGTSTAARATSESKKTSVKTTEQPFTRVNNQPSEPGRLLHLCRCVEASSCFGYLAGVWFGWPAGGVSYAQKVGCDEGGACSSTLALFALLEQKNVAFFST